jgi:ATP-binding cassette subfamily B protein
MKFRHVFQRDMMDCGAACLAMVCEHYGRRVPLHDVREQSGLGRQGVSLLGIAEAAESYGLQTLSAELSYEQLIENAANYPCILHWSQGHFVVLVKHLSKTFWQPTTHFIVADPSKGVFKMSEDSFKSSWISNRQNSIETGIALFLEPGDAFLASDTKADEPVGIGLKPILKYLLGYKPLIGQLLLCLSIAAGLQLLLPFLTRNLVDRGIGHHDVHFVYVILLAQLALFLGKMTVEIVQSWILLHISTRINVKVLSDFLIKLMKLPLRYFDSKRTGDILQRMSDHQEIEDFLTRSSLSALFSSLSLFVFAGVLAYYSWSIFGIFALSSVLYLAWIASFLKKRKELNYERFGLSAQEQGLKIQMIEGMQEIKLQDCARQTRSHWEEVQARLFRLQSNVLALGQWQESGSHFINEVKNILITILCAVSVISGEMTLGTMLAVQYIVGQLNTPLNQMIDFIQKWQDAKISIDRLNEIHSLKDEEEAERSYIQELPRLSARLILGGKGSSDPNRSARVDGAAYSTSQMSPAIHLRNVTFTYDGAGNEPVLNDITLDVPAGKTTAIVGVSGSGKTTLLKILLKFYDPQAGDIAVADVPLASISHRGWRRQCGVVMQDSFIFSDTIGYNIAVGDRNPDQERLRHATHVANITEFIESLPLGFHTKIGQEGVGISMGQKQRILIARAVYKNPDYIFLDEATNSLDASNESIIIKNLENFFSGKTVIVVAHRLSTVQHADQIIAMEQGRVIERGTHQELVALGGKYYSLVRNQLQLGD